MKTTLISTISSITILLLLLFAAGCGQTPENNNTTHQAHEDQAMHQQPGDEDMVMLHNGQRWEANPETTEGIQNMMRHMSSVSGSESSDAYKGLKSDLESEFTMIFQKCTMTGEAHDQLHNYLLPMKDMFKGLTSDNLDTQKENFKALQDHLSKYSTYFE